MNCISFRRREARDQIQHRLMSVEKVTLPVVDWRAGWGPGVMTSVRGGPLRSARKGGTEGTESLSSFKLSYSLFFSLLTSRDLDIPFPGNRKVWPQNWALLLAVPLRDLFKRTFKMPTAWQDKEASLKHTRAMIRTSSLTVAHWSHSTTVEKRWPWDLCWLVGLQHDQGGCPSPLISIERAKPCHSSLLPGAQQKPRERWAGLDVRMASDLCCGNLLSLPACRSRLGF